MDQAKLERFIDRCWDDEVVPRLVEYIRIPNKSPAFDPQWAAHGHMDAAVALFEGWARRQLGALAGATVEVVRLPGRTPLILIDIPGATRSVVPGATRSVVPGATRSVVATRRADDCVLLYGHLDKQPEMTGWADGTGPWIPVLRDDKLYGRGGADDGYAMFGALSAILALREQKVPHARAVLLIEACEESGSYDLPHYVDHLAGRLGTPSLVVCLDSGCGNYDQLWLTTSLRGLVSGTLTVEVLTEGVHSGDASGIVPSSFRILRQLLSRLEDETTGAIHVAALHADIPADRRAQAERAAAALGDEIYTKFPLVPGLAPVATDPTELVLNRTWRPQLAVTGMAGLPAPGNAGNVLLPFTAAKLTLRLPPTLDGPRAVELVGKLLEADPPYGARIRFDGKESSTGWNAPALAPWLGRSLADAAEAAFHAPPAYMGEGGTIPFMAMLGEKFPHAQFVVTGVLGPQSNAHGPNEFLHIPTAKRLSAVIARVLADHHAKAA